jgi:septation ring formation regulator EzrA
MKERRVLFVSWLIVALLVIFSADMFFQKKGLESKVERLERKEDICRRAFIEKKQELMNFKANKCYKNIGR